MSAPSSASTTLLGLPAELRREIFSVLFRPITIRSDSPGEQHRLAILQVCRQIYLEVAPLLLPNVTVYCHGNAAVLETLSRIGPARISQLRHLIVTHIPIAFKFPRVAQPSDAGTADPEEEREYTVGDDGSDPDYNGLDDDDDVRFFHLGSLLGLFPGLQLDLLEVFCGVKPGLYTCYHTADCLATLLEADGYQRLWMHAAGGDEDGEAVFGQSSPDRWSEIIDRRFKPYAGWKVKIDVTEWDRREIYRGPEWGPLLASARDDGTRPLECPPSEREEGTDANGHGTEDLADIVVRRGSNTDFVVKSGDTRVLRCIERSDVRNSLLFFRKASDALRKMFEENSWEDIKAMPGYDYCKTAFSDRFSLAYDW